MSEKKISPCPVPGCGGEMLASHTDDYTQEQVLQCSSCNYANGTAAHEALCADVKFARAHREFVHAATGYFNKRTSYYTDARMNRNQRRHIQHMQDILALLPEADDE